MMKYLVVTAVLLSFMGANALSTLYGSCTVNSDCPANANCAKGTTGPGKCLCNTYFTGGSTACVPVPRALSETCTDNTQCQKYDAKSECKKASGAAADTEGVCECKQPYGRDSTGLKCTKLPCYVSSVCIKAQDTEYVYTPTTTDHFCNSSGYCNCGSGYKAMANNSGCEPDKRLVYESCVPNAQCPEHDRKGVKSVGSCTASKCACKTGYKTNSGNSSCDVDAKLFYQPCSVVDQCPDNAICSVTCKCVTNYYKVKDNNNDTCVVDSMKLGAACINDIQCPPHRDPTGTIDIVVTGSCSTSCICKPGWLPSAANDSCLLVEKKIGDATSVKTQCIYSSPTRNVTQVAFGKCDCINGYKPATDLKSCEVDKKNLTNACFVHEQCPPSQPGGSGMCSTTCVCDAGHTNTNGVCVPDGKYLGDACAATSQCASKDANAVCGATESGFGGIAECFCKFGFDRDGYKCVPAKKALSQFCVDDSSCVIVNSRCDVDGLCKCKAGYKSSVSNDSCEIVSKLVGESCSIREQCPGGGSSSCASGVCSCIAGYQASADKRNCDLVTKSDGESCVINDQCPSGATCKTTCTCDSGLMFDGNSSACVRPQVGGACTTYCTANAQCIGGKCVCASGFSSSSGGSCLAQLGAACTSAEQCAYMPHATCGKDSRGYKTCLCLDGSTLTTGVSGKSYCSGTARLLVSLSLLFLVALPMLL